VEDRGRGTDKRPFSGGGKKPRRDMKRGFYEGYIKGGALQGGYKIREKGDQKRKHSNITTSKCRSEHRLTAAEKSVRVRD